MKRSIVASVSLVLLFFIMINAQTKFAAGDPYMVVGDSVPPDSHTNPPQIIITSPENNSLLNTNQITFSFTITVGESTTAVLPMISRAYLEGDWLQKPIDLTAINRTRPMDFENQSFNVTLTDIPLGRHSITINATESGIYVVRYPIANIFNIGNTVKLNFIVDTFLPNISILSLDNRTFNSPNIPLKFTLDRPASWLGYITWLGFSLDKETNTTITGNTTLSNLPNGRHQIVIYAIDCTGNSIASPIADFEVYTPPPTLSNISVENKTYTSNNIALSFNVNESSQTFYSLDNQANVTLVGNTTLTGLADGSHCITVYANDEAGNIGISETVFFTVNTSTPSPSPTPTQTQSPSPLLTPSPSIPEFPSWTLLFLTMATVLVAVIIAKRNRARQSSSNKEKQARD